jgi:hypothetical protein
MVLRYAHHQPESLRGGAEVLDRLRRESGTKLAQFECGLDGGYRLTPGKYGGGAPD